MATVLVTEDDESTLLIIKRALEPEHHTIACRNVKETWAVLNQRHVDLILLDVGLPDGDGFELFTDLQKKPELYKSTPVLFVTGKSGVSDQVLGYSLGAEDYILKPIHPLLLRTRVNARFEKLRKIKKETEVAVIGNIRFDLPKQKAYICPEPGDLRETELDLTPLEFKLLLHFALREDQVFSRDQLLTSIWGDGTHIVDRTIDTHICHLRNKLKGSTHTLEAVHGMGYRITARSACKGSGKSPSSLDSKD